MNPVVLTDYRTLSWATPRGLKGRKDNSRASTRSSDLGRRLQTISSSLSSSYFYASKTPSTSKAFFFFGDNTFQSLHSRKTANGEAMESPRATYLTKLLNEMLIYIVSLLSWNSNWMAPLCQVSSLFPKLLEPSMYSTPLR